MKKNVIRKIITVVLIFVSLAFIGYFLSSRDANEDYVLSSGEVPDEPKIIVNVSGEVKNAGKYSVPFGSTVHDVLYAAGGVKTSADLAAMSLDGRLFEDCDLNVPQKVYVSANEKTSDTKDYTNAMVNINTADVDELANLPEIGETLARNIVNYREVNGLFENTEDIINVSGIGPKKYDQIKDKITVGGN